MLWSFWRLRASWSFRMLGGVAGVAGEEQQQVVFEIMQGLGRDVAAARPSTGRRAWKVKQVMPPIAAMY